MNNLSDFSFWKQFKSGTDIRGVASEGVKEQHINLTDDVTSLMAGSFVKWLEKKTPSKTLRIAVGRDSRISGPRIRDVITKEFASQGASVFDCGLASTPAMFMTTIDFENNEFCDGAVQITASHHPFNRNGLKFFTKNGGLESEDIEAILKIACEHHTGFYASIKKAGSITEINYMSRYSDGLKDMIKKDLNDSANYNKPLEGFHLVVDAGNGAGGFYATDVLEPLGANISGSQFLSPDGMFPNHTPNPEDPKAMESISKATLENHADLGIIFDTDVDRAGCVDKNGKEINRNRLVALASVIALENMPGGTIVTDSVTSDGLKLFIEKDLKAKHHRFKRGYKNVINEAIRLNAEGILSPLAIETSGHAALKENHFLDDGAYLVTKIIIKALQMKKEGKSLNHLIENLVEPAESIELRFNITDDDFKNVGNRILKDLEVFANDKGYSVADDSYEGLRVSFNSENGNGWLLLRLSVHDPVMPLNIESSVAGGSKIIAEKLFEFLKGQKNLDISTIENFLKQSL